MILRKPYAFFIKHFKLLNVILAALEVYVIYKLSFLLHFFFEYSSYPQGSIGRDLVGELLQARLFVFHIIILAFTALILVILFIKKKPRKLYMFIIIEYILSIVILLIAKHFLEIMQVQIIENRTAFLIRDFIAINFITQIFIMLLTAMRALGFDIKKFQFGQDLHNLDISSEDNEEFVVQIDVDSNELKRSFNQKRRELKYFIYENKTYLILFIASFIAIVTVFFYVNSGIYFGTKKVDEFVNIDTFTFSVGETYLTTKDSHGNDFVKDNVIVIVPITIKTSELKNSINPASFSLVIGDNVFYHTTVYSEKIGDFGKVYNSDVITQDFKTYLLVFEIPKSLASKNAYLEYYSLDEKTIKFTISKQNVDLNTETISSSIGEKLKLNDVIVKNGELQIEEVGMSEIYIENFNFCIYEKYCFETYEYITPDFVNNYDKTLLKIIGTFTNDENIDLFTLIKNYGTLIYSINGVTKTQNVVFKQVLPQKATINNTYYIEILKEVEEAEHMSLVFSVRGKKYIYKLK